MHEKEVLQTFIQPLSGLPQWVSERILLQINQLAHYEPVIGIMGKTGAGKSSLCNTLFAGEVSPVSDVAACTREPLRFRLQVGERVMTIVDLPGVVARRFFLHQNAINFALPEGAKKTHSAQCKNERKECLLMLLLSRITFVESRQADPIFESYITM